jgi:hypothetical protein
MAPEVLAAIVTGVVSLILAVYNFLVTRQQDKRVVALEDLRSKLAREEAASRAKLDYEYDARRRLYDRFEPALFQLLDLAEYALDRITNLARPAVWPDFTQGEPDPPEESRRPAMVAPKYEAVSTLYGLYAPLVIVRSMSRNLTMVDLSLEERAKLQYRLARQIYGSFKDDGKLAEIEPPIHYEPFAPGWRKLREDIPQRYWWQGLTMGRLESLLDIMTVESPSAPEGRLMSFGEFERLYEEVFQRGAERDRKTLAVASNALYRFSPNERPVFWRILIAQARLYQALLRTRAGGFNVPRDRSDWRTLLRLEDSERFTVSSGGPHAASLKELLQVTDHYLTDSLFGSQLGQGRG